MAGDEGAGEITRLPENCISHAISFTSPGDSCRSAVVSTTFRSAADSDTVWECFLPADYEEIIARAVDPVEFSSKKELYFRLCDPILVDGGRMSFSLERSTGHKCYTLSARELVIIRGDTPGYWKWVPRVLGSRFPEFAKLVEVCWLDIKGRLDSKLLTPRTNYAAYLIFKLAPDTYGFGFPSQFASVRAGIQNSRNEICLKPEVRQTHHRHPPTHPYPAMMEHQLSTHPYPAMMEHQLSTHPYLTIDHEHIVVEETSTRRTPLGRADGWMELELGEFFNGEGDEGEVEILLWETASHMWKSGLIIEGIEVRPK